MTPGSFSSPNSVSFNLEVEAELVHKLLKHLEAEVDSKRILRALSEIIPHFFVAMVLNLKNKDDNEDVNCVLELNSTSISKWNQVDQILTIDQRSNFMKRLNIWRNIDWKENKDGNERFDILFSLFINQGD